MPMHAEIISIGDELLIGQTVNTNASWLGSSLGMIGIPVKWGVTIADGRTEILETFETAFKRSDLIIVTGGLGPTKDDITKQVLCDFFETELVMNEEALERITSYFTARGREMLEVNRQQAALPASCKVIQNHHGTACGMWFEKDGKVLISLPGVPYEMKGMMQDSILELIQEKFNVKSAYHKTILTTGIGESFLADQMKDWENRIRANGFGLAYLPSPGIVKLRITSDRGEQDAAEIDRFLKEIEQSLPKHTFGYENDTLSDVVGKLVLSENKTVGTVESCTGGGIGNYFVSIPGSSAYFQGGFVTYSNALKMKLADVSEQTLLNFGAVSEETVIEMALGGKKNLEVDYCISVSGIAGPDGGSDEKPVGTVWIAVAHPEGIATKKFNFGDNRERTLQMTIFAAMNLLRCTILKIVDEKK